MWRSPFLIVSTVFAFVLMFVLTLSLMVAVKWSTLETRGVRVTAIITGFERPSRGPGLDVIYQFPNEGKELITARSYLTVALVSKLAIGDRLPAVYDALRASGAALLVSFPDDHGHPFRKWLRDMGRMLCLILPIYFLSAVITPWRRERPPPNARRQFP